MSLSSHFPYETPRQEQIQAIAAAVQTFLKNDKKFFILEAGTGVGKSAIGLTLGRVLNEKLPFSDEYTKGSYFLTTQRVLQEQYENDFGKPSGKMTSVYSSKNYQCEYHKRNDCRTSQQMLRTEDKSSRFFKKCTIDCLYKREKKLFLESPGPSQTFLTLLWSQLIQAKLLLETF